MFLTLIFAVVLLICFGIVLVFTRATQTEVAVRRSLEELSKEHVPTPADATILKDERLSPSPWFHNLLAGVPLSWKLLNLIKQAGSKQWVSATLGYCLIGAFGGAIFTAIATSNSTLIPLGVIAGTFSPIGYLYVLRYRRLAACNRLLPQAIELMSRALRAGLALNSAIEMAGRDIPEPLGSEFRTAHEQQSLGLPFRDAMLNFLDRVPLEDMRFLTTALLLQRDTGGNLVQILDTVVAVMRDRIRIRGQVRIYTAQARVTGWIVSCMPIFMYLALSVINPRYINLLITDPAGRAVFYFGCGMWFIGILLVRKIATIKV